MNEEDVVHGVVEKIAEKWLAVHSMKRNFSVKEKDIVMEFAVFVDELMEDPEEMEEVIELGKVQE